MEVFRKIESPTERGRQTYTVPRECTVSMRYLPEIRHSGQQNASFLAWERGYQPFTP